MQIRVVSGVIFFCACLASCTFFGKEEKTIVAEIFSDQQYYSADAKALQKNNAAEVRRVKKLIMNEELLSISIQKSGFNHTVPEVKKALSFSTPANTTIIEIRYSADEMKGAATFLDTLITNLIAFDIRDEYQRSDKAIRQVEFRLDSVSRVLDEYKYKEITGEQTVKAEDLFLELMQRKANLMIEKAGIYPKIKILSWAREEL
jgi:hypothetical protein